VSTVLPQLHADCARCAALCCVVPGFSRSSDFAIDKPPVTPCPNLLADHRCGIHDLLRERGFAGCTVYDCFGAGQRVTQQTFGGASWQDDPELLPAMAEVFPQVRLLHEVLRYLVEARGLPRTEQLADRLDAAIRETDELAGSPYADLAHLDAESHRAAMAPLLLAASERAREVDLHPREDLRGADAVGAAWAARDLRAASLRGAVLVGADLRGADLRGADLIGADLRGADLRGADLRGCLFVVQHQLDAARGDDRTRLPAALRRPAHW
jgi:hypothetical protein